MDLLFGVALVLGVMILVHEWGHFIAARILVCALMCSRSDLARDCLAGSAEPRIIEVSALPLGGYVRMAGQDPSEIDSARSTAIHGKEKDEKADGSAPQEQGLVKSASDELMKQAALAARDHSFAGRW